VIRPNTAHIRLSSAPIAGGRDPLVISLLPHRAGPKLGSVSRHLHPRVLLAMAPHAKATPRPIKGRRWQAPVLFCDAPGF
jgi:hypothetical protein